MSLPRGQHLIDDFPRFGLIPYAERFPANPNDISLRISGDVQTPLSIDDEFSKLPMRNQVSDFHCVTTWSTKNLRWRGFLFRDVLKKIIQPIAQVDPKANYVVFMGQDGYKNILPLKDLMADDVLLATHLDDEPLGIAHGGPLRLIAPSHYGYKSVKHIKQIDFLIDPEKFKTPWFFPLVAHPRGRVELEERSVLLPNWLFRFVFSKFINSNRLRFERALQQYELMKK
ncbi:MAG: molybdopterin-dependent oxidoreductase [Devosiaceae bacterium]|nr:molybdopterin-dependent oxidoreductase [Devosiaceae bacterium]